MTFDAKEVKITEKRDKIALYARVSSDEQRESTSIETQEDFLADYCKLYGYALIHPIGEGNPYRDNGVSGTVPLHERPGGARLLEDVEAGLVQTVLVYRLDRLGRTLLSMIDAHNRIEEASCALQSATEPIDTSTPSSRLIFHMLASFAEFERETIVERTRDGMKRFFRGGRYTGRIPYGYDIDSEWEVEEEEARVVRELMINLANGSTIRAEARRLNVLGVPAPDYRYRGRPRVQGEEWKVSTISKMVSRSTYVGRHVVKSGGEEIVRE
jgi:site-specific DNA recombinase